MGFRVEFRYAVLNSIIILLWLTIEYVAGFQDRFIAWYPAVTLLSIIVPIICYRLAFKERIEKADGKFSFGRAFTSGLTITILVCILVIPVQLIFFKIVNPDFLLDMVKYSIQTGRQNAEGVAVYFRFGNFLVETILFTFFEGIIISLILAWKMRTVK